MGFHFIDGGWLYMFLQYFYHFCKYSFVGVVVVMRWVFYLCVDYILAMKAVYEDVGRFV